MVDIYLSCDQSGNVTYSSKPLTAPSGGNSAKFTPNFSADKAWNIWNDMFPSLGLKKDQIKSFVPASDSDMIRGITSMAYLLAECHGLTDIDLSKISTDDVVDMQNMFNQCISLVSIDLSNFNTENVTDMGGMFNTCTSLTSLDLSMFDMSNVAHVHQMFYGDYSLTSLNLHGVGARKLENMEYMFFSCRSLTSLDLRSFDTSNVTNMSYMFTGCSSLTALWLYGFYSVAGANMSNMFEGCDSLEMLDMPFMHSTDETVSFGDTTSLKIVRIGQDAKKLLSYFRYLPYDADTHNAVNYSDLDAGTYVIDPRLFYTAATMNQQANAFKALEKYASGTDFVPETDLDKDRMTATLRQIHQAANAFRNRHGLPSKGNDLSGGNDVAVSIVQLARTMMALREELSRPLK